ncbi:hypothetical protein H4R27_004723 [Coemansia aciculifera]|nr:hypothetical protein H4R27_004723 [Coemansia aciculifera]
MLHNWLVERGHSLLSRANSSNRKSPRQDRIVALPADVGTVGLPTHGADAATATAVSTGAFTGHRSTPSSRVTAPTVSIQNKGAAEFRVRGITSTTAGPISVAAIAAAPSPSPLTHRHMSEDGAAISSLPSSPRQRTKKLVRDPRNTNHMRHSRSSRTAHSMDVDRAHSVELRHQQRPPGLLTQLFSCCTPVSLFRRGTSYGSTRNDARRSGHPQPISEDDSAASQDQTESQPPHIAAHRQRPVPGRNSATDTAVGAESLDDRSSASSKSTSVPGHEPKVEVPLPHTDSNGEIGWLMPPQQQSQAATSAIPAAYIPADNEDYSGTGSGFVGGFAVRQTLPTNSATSAIPQRYAPLPPPSTTSPPTSDFAYNSAYSDFDTDAGVSSFGNSVYRTPPTSIGDLATSSVSGIHPQQQVELGHGAPSETPVNSTSKMYLGDETSYEHLPRKITLETSSVDPESIVDDDDLDSEEENELRVEIISPPGNVATESSERLVNHVVDQYLLPPLSTQLRGKKCLVLDLDETLVHSSFREVEHPDYVVPVILEGQEHNVYVLKRPGVDEFMRIMGQYYEIVVFTASLSMYADPVLDLLDKSKVVHHRLFRESCNLYNGNYVKDLSRLGRDVSQSIIIDNSPASYAFHTNNAIGISTWLNDPMDTELRDLIPFLIDLTGVDDVSAVLSLTHGHSPFAHHE